jgi:hypothetical protein
LSQVSQHLATVPEQILAFGSQLQPAADPMRMKEQNAVSRCCRLAEMQAREARPSPPASAVVTKVRSERRFISAVPISASNMHHLMQ